MTSDTEIQYVQMMNPNDSVVILTLFFIIINYYCFLLLLSQLLDVLQ